MKAVAVHSVGELRLEEIPLPPVPAGSIRVQVKACAICGTDLRIYRRGDYRAQYPVVALGTVEASMSEIIACCLNAQKNSQVNKGDTGLAMKAAPRASSTRRSRDTPERERCS